MIAQEKTRQQRRWLWAALAACLFASTASADTIVFTGAITQSTQDGTGPAVNNPALNNVVDGNAFKTTLDFTGSIPSLGTYPLPGAILTFSDPSAPAGESSFSSVSLSVLTDGSFYDLSLLGCLTTGSSCGVGNELAAYFAIPSSALNSQNVIAQPVAGILPLDLLEDDGVTDIHGSVTNYSYAGAVVLPEPAEVLPMCLIFALMAWMGLRPRHLRTGERQ